MIIISGATRYGNEDDRYAHVQLKLYGACNEHVRYGHGRLHGLQVVSTHSLRLIYQSLVYLAYALR